MTDQPMPLPQALQIVQKTCNSFHGCSVTPGGTLEDHQLIQAAFARIHDALRPLLEPDEPVVDQAEG